VNAATAGESLRKKKRKKRPPPPQSEIAQIRYWTFEEERQSERTVVRMPFFGQQVRETVVKTIKVRRYQFWAQAVGPAGVYIAGESPPFQGDTQYVPRSRFSGEEQVIRTPQSRAALNVLLAKLWADGWQPTGWGQSWHDFRLRRLVSNPSLLPPLYRADQLLSRFDMDFPDRAPAEPSSDSEIANAPDGTPKAMESTKTKKDARLYGGSRVLGDMEVPDLTSHLGVVPA
jgi:hypothetical protein